MCCSQEKLSQAMHDMVYIYISIDLQLSIIGADRALSVSLLNLASHIAIAIATVDLSSLDQSSSAVSTSERTCRTGPPGATFMAFAPPQRSRPKSNVNTTRSHLPLPSPSKKTAKTQSDTSDLKAAPTRSDVREARVIPSRYAQSAAARQATPIRAARTSNLEQNGRSTHSASVDLRASVASQSASNTSPVRRATKATPIDAKEERDLLSLRILQNTQTVLEANEALRQYKLSAETQLEKRWEQVKAMNMERQMQLMQARMKRDAQELKSLTSTEIQCLDTLLSRMNTIEEQSDKITADVDDWSTNVRAPIKSEWIRANDHLQDVCRSTRLIIRPLMRYTNLESDLGVVSELTQELVGLLDAVVEVTMVQKDFARARWHDECHNIVEEYGKLMDTIPSDSLTMPFMWDCSIDMYS